MAESGKSGDRGVPSYTSFSRRGEVRSHSSDSRAATSVPANIAEGWGRGSTKEYIQFLLIARGSLMELETHMIITQKLRYLSQGQLGAIQKEVEEIGKMLNGLIQSLRGR